MKERSRFGRRKSDKTVWLIAIVAAVALITTYAVSCGDSPGPTTSSPSAYSPGDAAANVPPAQPADAEQPAAAPETDLSHNSPQGIVDPLTGVVTINNFTHHSLDLEICYFKAGPHPQQLLTVQQAPVAADRKGVTFQVPVEELDLGCDPLELQVDIVRNHTCDRGSNNLELLPGDQVAAFPTIPGDNPWIKEDKKEYGDWSKWTGCSEVNRETCVGTRTRAIDWLQYEREKCGPARRVIDKGTDVESASCQIPFSNAWTLTPKNRVGYFRVEVDGAVVFEDWIKRDQPYEFVTEAGVEVKVFENRFFKWYLETTKTGDSCKVLEPEFNASCSVQLVVSCICVLPE